MLYGQKIFAARDLPYRTQLTPLAAILAILGDRADNDGVRAKLARWYWCGVFGELYGGAIETRFAKDLPEVLNWIDGEPHPATITDANFARERLFTLQTRNSAAYKGLYALLLQHGGLDFRTGDPIDVQMYFDDKIDIHHIFPQDWCNQHFWAGIRGVWVKVSMEVDWDKIISQGLSRVAQKIGRGTHLGLADAVPTISSRLRGTLRVR